MFLLLLSNTAGRPRKDRSASSQDNPVSTSTLSSSAAVPPGQVAQSSTSSTAAATLPPSPPPPQPQTFMPSPPLVSSPNPPTLAPISPDRPPLPDTPDEYHDELDGTPMPLPSEHEEVLARWRSVFFFLFFACLLQVHRVLTVESVTID